jgi:hypothetical protein
MFAREIHEDYNHHREAEGKKNEVVAYDNLSEDMINSNRDAAADIPLKLLSIGYGIRKWREDGPVPSIKFSKKQVAELACLEHERWNRERLLQGWKYGPKRDRENKISPYLVEFSKLPTDIQMYDIQTVVAIPKIAKKLGFEIYKMKETA